MEDFARDVQIQQIPDYNETSFNIRMPKEQLMSPDITLKQRFRLLLGLHYKVWHLGAGEIKRVLLQGGFGVENAKLARAVIDRCSICKAWKRTLSRLQASLGTIVIISMNVFELIFSLRERTYITFADYCIHWALCSFLSSKIQDHG
jgi:hypothetical protein